MEHIQLDYYQTDQCSLHALIQLLCHTNNEGISYQPVGVICPTCPISAVVEFHQGFTLELGYLCHLVEANVLLHKTPVRNRSGMLNNQPWKSGSAGSHKSVLSNQNVNRDKFVKLVGKGPVK